MSKIATFTAQVFTHSDYPELGLGPSEWREADTLADLIKRQMDTVSRRSYTQIPSPVLIFIRRCRRNGMTPTAISRALNERNIPTPGGGASWYSHSVVSALGNGAWELLSAPGREQAGTAVEAVRAVLEHASRGRIALTADDRAELERATAVLVRI